MRIAMLFAVLLGVGLAMPLCADDTPAMKFSPSDADMDKGRLAVKEQNWKQAVESFERATKAEPNNADTHNMLGFALRKSGNLDMSFKAYNQALKLDPRHRGAHEYIGEAYLMANNPGKAEEHLAQLDRLCTFSCSEFSNLKKAIEDYKRTKK